MKSPTGRMSGPELRFKQIGSEAVSTFKGATKIPPGSLIVYDLSSIEMRVMAWIKEKNK